jgi:hypothetical protein
MYLHTGSLTVSTFFYSSFFPTLTFIYEEKNMKHEKLWREKNGTMKTLKTYQLKLQGNTDITT